uniref:40S ribosomal protein S27 n=1 Tax=Canis lupus familiaris TaxID=9615 RepID=A0A8C0MGV5_CANLF
MDVKCRGCYKITTVFSHAQMVVLCVDCSTVLCQPMGGKTRLTEGCSFRRNTNDLHNLLNLCYITESLISSVIPVNLPR